MEKDLDYFLDMNKDLDAEAIAELSPLQLAYIGDAVYELFIRSYILSGNKSVHDLHVKATDYVKAEAQADIIHKLKEGLSDREIRIVKRGRNAKSNTRAKGASMIDYRYSTGYEALIGYLYLRKEYSRLEEIVRGSIDLVEGDGNE